jgi:hypothetical protein
MEKISNITSRPISTKLDANFPCMKGIQACLNKGTDPQKCKHRVGSFKNLFIKNQ